MQPFSDTVMEHFYEPKNVGQLPSPCGEGNAGSVKRGVFMRMYVVLDDDRVSDVRYLTYGCVPAIAAGSLMTEWARGRNIEDVLVFKPQQLIDALGGLPRARHFCAKLAVQALQDAVLDAQRKGERNEHN